MTQWEWEELLSNSRLCCDGGTGRKIVVILAWMGANGGDEPWKEHSTLESAGSIHHVMWFFPYKSWPKNTKTYHITWRPWAFKTNTLGITWCHNFWPNLRLEVGEGFHIRWRMLAARRSKGFSFSHQVSLRSLLLRRTWTFEEALLLLRRCCAQTSGIRVIRFATEKLFRQTKPKQTTFTNSMVWLWSCTVSQWSFAVGVWGCYVVREYAGWQQLILLVAAAFTLAVAMPFATKYGQVRSSPRKFLCDVACSASR